MIDLSPTGPVVVAAEVVEVEVEAEVVEVEVEAVAEEAVAHLHFFL
jgi:acyl-coenzyme A thioesterase PaaI-like protein